MCQWYKCNGTILAQKLLFIRTDPRCMIQLLFSAIANLLVEKMCDNHVNHYIGFNRVTLCHTTI